MPADVLLKLVLSIGVAFAVSFALTIPVKHFAERIGAIDVPDGARRVHDHPIPRMGGLAIFLGFMVSVLLFVDISEQVKGILIGAVIIVTVGAVDDTIQLKWWIKLLAQIAAAVVAVCYGLIIRVVMNPLVFADAEHLVLGALSVPLTIIWIVGVTNSVNLIDGLDGLACGVSAISSVTMLAASILIPSVDDTVALLLGALAGACVGFLPFNLNPAKIFMGDTGALLLGFVLATVSVMGMFKFYAIITFIVPLLALALPVFDTLFAILRRLVHRQNPMMPDRGHLHHRLLDMGLSQKQAVAILYCASAIIGAAAVVLTSNSNIKIYILLGMAVLVLALMFLMRGRLKPAAPQEEKKDSKDE